MGFVTVMPAEPIAKSVLIALTVLHVKIRIIRRWITDVLVRPSISLVKMVNVYLVISDASNVLRQLVCVRAVLDLFFFKITNAKRTVLMDM